jgi:hypothetical protein
LKIDSKISLINNQTLAPSSSQPKSSCREILRRAVRKMTLMEKLGVKKQKTVINKEDKDLLKF